MREAVIVSTARTPIGKAYRGSFNNTGSPELAGHALSAAAERAKVDPAQIEDVIAGSAIQQGTAALNLGRLSALRAGFPDSVPGMTIDRQCASGMMAIATAAKQVISDNMQVAAAVGVESISMNQTGSQFVIPDPWLLSNMPHTYICLLYTSPSPRDS